MNNFIGWLASLVELIIEWLASFVELVASHDGFLEDGRKRVRSRILHLGKLIFSRAHLGITDRYQSSALDRESQCSHNYTVYSRPPSLQDNSLVPSVRLR